MNKLQRGSRRFKGKFPFKCFTCGGVGHYVDKCPHDKGKIYTEGNIISYYTHEDSDGLSNCDEDDQDFKLLTKYENDTL